MSGLFPIWHACKLYHIRATCPLLYLPKVG